VVLERCPVRQRSGSRPVNSVNFPTPLGRRQLWRVETFENGPGKGRINAFYRPASGRIT